MFLGVELEIDSSANGRRGLGVAKVGLHLSDTIETLGFSLLDL